MNEIEHQLKRQLIAKREIHPDQIQQAEQRLYEYQVKIGSPAMYFTYERNGNE